jgi:hypothetical protein
MRDPKVRRALLDPAAFAVGVGSSKRTTVHVRVARKRQTLGGRYKMEALFCREWKENHEVKRE